MRLNVFYIKTSMKEGRRRYWGGQCQKRDQRGTPGEESRLLWGPEKRGVAGPEISRDDNSWLPFLNTCRNFCNRLSHIILLALGFRFLTESWVSQEGASRLLRVLSYIREGKGQKHEISLGFAVDLLEERGWNVGP